MGSSCLGGLMTQLCSHAYPDVTEDLVGVNSSREENYHPGPIRLLDTYPYSLSALAPRCFLGMEAPRQSSYCAGSNMETWS